MLNSKQICKNSDEFFEARVVTFLNPYSFLKLKESNISLHNFDKLCIDGIALKLFLSLVYRDKNIERLSFDFTSLAQQVFSRAASKDEHGYILGSDQESNDAFINTIQKSFTGIRLDGRSGYFNSQADIDKNVELLASSDYDFIVIGMGAVKQEQIASALVDSGYKGRVYTCGGFIHQTAMNGGEYYPAWVDKFNLRFLYRMYKEPATICRYLIDYPKAFYLLSRNIESFKH